MATNAPAHYPTNAPITPAKAQPSDSKRLRDSPFSDYFTDDGRSPGPDDNSNHLTVPSPEKRQLLVRLNSLQTQLIHGEHESERQTLDIVERKVHEIENQLNALHSQTRMPPEMEDSGLFMEDDDEEEEQERNGSGHHHHHTVTPAQKQAEADFILLESQRVLESVTKANEQLRQRLAETKTLHETHLVELEARDHELAILRAEREALQSDLEANNSELLFLQLQFKALEREVEAMDVGAARLETYAPELREDIQRVKRMRIAEEMGKWSKDWEGVGARMAKRRENAFGEGVNSSAGGEGEEWQLETVKQEDGKGKVASITVRRVEGSHQPPTLDDAEIKEVGAAEITLPTESEGEEVILIQEDAEGAAEGAEEITHIEAIDCAITTSSDDDDEENDDTFTITRKGKAESVASGRKTAWQELWDGLAVLAGMGEERF
ncbi:hypothetical protein BDY17DRAFT_327929 [Neohortaea acidophila]|uniref:Uncharacterized protein n=1 Tax=Neohortaea acidophila TaxID=245834 RepID=A0A6A6PHC5_9PEZI|nr:uncharacterized protein BDY17DRAFT_327929 [Neohortaea acidophila]KAF2479141.1 hypothetical protein BDY17DRAFT_327929 [Neohortaea acidophila]